VLVFTACSEANQMASPTVVIQKAGENIESALHAGAHLIANGRSQNEARQKIQSEFDISPDLARHYSKLTVVPLEQL